MRSIILALLLTACGSADPSALFRSGDVPGDAPPAVVPDAPADPQDAPILWTDAGDAPPATPDAPAPTADAPPLLIVDAPPARADAPGDAGTDAPARADARPPAGDAGTDAGDTGTDALPPMTEDYTLPDGAVYLTLSWDGGNLIACIGVRCYCRPGYTPRKYGSEPIACYPCAGDPVLELACYQDLP